MVGQAFADFGPNLAIAANDERRGSFQAVTQLSQHMSPRIRQAQESLFTHFE
jgi:hypothetical protein